VLERRYLAVELPEFNVMAVNKSFRLLDRGRIIAAHQIFEVGDMAVRTDQVGAIFGHVMMPLMRLFLTRRSNAVSQAGDCLGGDGDGAVYASSAFTVCPVADITAEDHAPQRQGSPALLAP
jgi:hypothetical protein